MSKLWFHSRPQDVRAEFPTWESSLGTSRGWLPLEATDASSVCSGRVYASPARAEPGTVRSATRHAIMDADRRGARWPRLMDVDVCPLSAGPPLVSTRDPAIGNRMPAGERARQLREAAA